MKRLANFCAALLAAMPLLACGDKLVATQVMVIIDAEPGVRAQAEQLHIVVQGMAGQDESASREPYDLLATKANRDLKWPMLVALTPLGGDATRPYELVATALDQSGDFVAQVRAISGYVSHKRLELRLLLEDSCIGNQTCDSDQTCRAGSCGSARVDPADLSDFTGVPTGAGADAGADAAVDAGADASADAGADAAMEPGGEPGVAKVGDACMMDSARACNSHDSKLPVQCNAGAWQGQSQCDDGTRCDTRPGATQGTCQQIATGCEDLKPADAFCAPDGSAISTCDADRVSVTDQVCAAGEQCSADTAVECVCKPGFVRDTDDCTDIDECKTDNGECDALTECTNIDGGRSCGDCPAGYLGDGVEGCAPTLTDLTLSTGTLSPALGPDVTDYSVQVALVTQTLTLTPTVPDGATVTINDDAVVSGQPWDSPVLDLGVNTLTLEVSQTGHPSHSYTLTVTRGEQEAYLKASNPGAYDAFGYSVSISGDTLVVGAHGESSNATGVGGNQTDNSAGGSGAAYVFVRSGSTWSQQAYLKASNTGASDSFGWSVSISGDTIVVGAYGDASNATGVGGNQTDNSAAQSGAAYVFVRSGSTWSQQAYLKASNTGASDLFGWSVSISGDTLVVGAYVEDSNATGVGGNQTDNTALSSGAAYVFVRSGSTWSQQAYLKASNTGADDQFGYSVSISGDTLVVGAYGEDSNATGVGGNQADDSASASGAAYVFVRSGSTWSQQGYLKASNTEATDQFGYGVSISGDTLVVGAGYEDSNAIGVNGNQADNSAAQSGAAYVFVRSGSTWTQQAYLKASNTGFHVFGGSVSISGDALVVGAYGDASNATGVGGDQANNNASSSGAAYLFVRDGSTWTQQAYLKASNTEASDQFGWSVSISDDTLVVGANSEDSNATGVDGDQTDNSVTTSGAAYVFR